ncbi:MAG: hypothetical protein IPP35_04280 [Elusimicrobia bacterium]|nr:hypothetical protein [Elusimicrobiota bacterium]
MSERHRPIWCPTYFHQTDMQHWTSVLSLGWLLFLREFRFIYRQTLLGGVWPILRATLTGIPFIFVGRHFSMGLKAAYPYELYALAGFIYWQVLWDTINLAQFMAYRLRMVMRDTYVPHRAILLAAVSHVAFNLVVYVVMFVVACFFFKFLPAPTTILCLTTIPLMVLTGLSIAIFIFPFTFIFNDFRFATPYLSSALVWCVPVFYQMPSEGLLHLLNKWNPMTYLVNIPRDWVLEGWHTSHWIYFPSMALVVAVFIIAERFVFRAIPIMTERIPR